MGRVLKKETIALVEKAFVNAASAFRVFTKNKVEMSIQYISASEEHDFSDFTYHLGDKLQVFETTVFGDAGGDSYLIINESNIPTLLDKALMGMGHDDKSALSIPLMVELDSVLAAATITEFSNALGLSIYGGVPNQFESDKTELMRLLGEKSHQYSEKGEYLTIGVMLKVKAAKEFDISFILILPSDYMIFDD